MLRVAPLVIVAVPAAVAAAAAAVAATAAGAPLGLIVMVAVAVTVAVAAWLWYRSPRAVLRALGAMPVTGGESSRLVNIVENLCAVNGLTEPEVHVTEPAVPNAAVVGRRRSGSHLVVTRGLLDVLDRLELEAVVARELCQIRRGVRGATVLAGVAGLLGSGTVAARLVGRMVDPRSVITDDIEASRLTRYPPALSSALTKLAEGGEVDSAPALRHLWMVEPKARLGTAAIQPPVSLRIDALEEI